MSTKTTPKKDKAFLEALTRSGNVTLSAHAAGLERHQVYTKRARNKKFAAAWEEAVAEACDSLEEAAWNRAVHGVEEPVFHRGDVCGAVQKYSDTLLIFLLKGNKQEKFMERQKQEVAGKVKFDIEIVDFSKALDE